MNREIKFRAWTAQKGMITPYAYIEQDNHFWGEDDTNSPFGEVYAVMQFTGLNDKNGVEIYEGDIVRIIDRTSRKEPFIAEVYYDLNVASFSGRVKGFPIRLFLHNPVRKDEWIPEIQPFINEGRSIEVIGNIYEHPGLIGAAATLEGGQQP